jgi:hypothetical protein
MTRFLWLALLLANAAGLIASEGAKTAPSAPSVGWIDDLRGPTFWKKDATSPERPLDPKRDRYRRLHVGERLRCDSGGYVKLQLYGGATEIKGPSSAWYPIPRVPPSRKLDDRAREEFLGGQPGGRPRGDRLGVFSPTPDGAIRPARFVFRWTPQTGHDPHLLVVQDLEGREIWSQGGIEGATGRLQSISAQQALTKYRAEASRLGRSLHLRLRITDSHGAVTEVPFSLLSPRDEAEMERELKPWDREPAEALMRHMGRASVFRRHRLYDEAAAEYDAALQTAPESRDLLDAAIQAHHHTGNRNREEELQRQLQAGSSAGLPMR